MSETMVALLILPVLIALVVTLECARTGCTWLHRRMRKSPSESVFTPAANVSAAQDY